MTQNQIAMVRALAENRIKDAKKYAVLCCIEDNTKKNEYLAGKYRAMLENEGPDLVELPSNLKGLLHMEDVSDFREERYYLGRNEKKILEKIEKANRAGTKLLEMGIPYMNSTLLYGEPGTGKTMFGRYVAYKLQLPFAYINFSYVIDSFMGGTSKNIRNIFDYCKGKPCVLMLDEIDCIGLKRSGGAENAAGEIARTTISLMQELDTMTNAQIVIAATNREDRLDEALKRRFFIQEEIRLFEEQERREMAFMFLDDTGVKYDAEEIMRYVRDQKTQADIIRFVTQIVIRDVLEDQEPEDQS